MQAVPHLEPASREPVHSHTKANVAAWALNSLHNMAVACHHRTVVHQQTSTAAGQNLVATSRSDIAIILINHAQCFLLCFECVTWLAHIVSSADVLSAHASFEIC